MNKRSLEAIAAVAEKWPEWNPLLHFAAVANDETLDPVIRLDAARAAAAYMLPRPKPVEMEPDALVDLERRLLAAKVDAAADAIANNRGLNGLAERLDRAKARVEIHVNTGIDRAPDDVSVTLSAPAPDLGQVIDAEPVQASQEARHGAASAAAGHAPALATEPPPAPAPAPYVPIARRADPAPPASADYVPPAVTWPERPAAADVDYNPFSEEPYSGGLLGSRS